MEQEDRFSKLEKQCRIQLVAIGVLAMCLGVRPFMGFSEAGKIPDVITAREFRLVSKDEQLLMALAEFPLWLGRERSRPIFSARGPGALSLTT